MILRIPTVNTLFSFLLFRSDWSILEVGMSSPFSKLRGLDSKASGEIALDVSKDLAAGGTDSFVTDFSAVLKNRLTLLSKALAESKKHQLTVECGEIHDELKQTYRDLRKVAKAQSEVVSLKERQVVSKALCLLFIRHGGGIDKLARHAMLSALANIFQEIGEDEENMISTAALSPIYEELVRLYQLLITKESERSEIIIEEDAVPCETEASIQVNNAVRSIYHHIKTYADISKEGYEEILAEFDTRAAPIFIQLKARETRHQHELEKSIEKPETTTDVPGGDSE